MLEKRMILIALFAVVLMMPGCYMMMGLSSAMNQDKRVCESDHLWDELRDQRDYELIKPIYLLERQYRKRHIIGRPDDHEPGPTYKDPRWVLPTFEAYNTDPEAWPEILTVLPAGSLVRVSSIRESNNITHTSNHIIGVIQSGEYEGRLIYLGRIALREYVEIEDQHHRVYFLDENYLKPVSSEN